MYMIITHLKQLSGLLQDNIYDSQFDYDIIQSPFRITDQHLYIN